MAAGGPARLAKGGGVEVTLSGRHAMSTFQHKRPIFLRPTSMAKVHNVDPSVVIEATRRWLMWWRPGPGPGMNHKIGNSIVVCYLAIEIRRSRAARRRRRFGRPGRCRRLPRSWARWALPKVWGQRTRCGCASDPWAAESRWWCSWWRPQVLSCIRLWERRAAHAPPRRNGNDRLWFRAVRYRREKKIK